MGFVDNVLMALASIRANKMRSLLTMLGIIIGIAAVIAIQTVGNSLTGSLNSEMSSFGASNITISLTEKSDDEDEYGFYSDDGFGGGVGVRMFRPASPGKDDLISDEMIEEFRQTFPNEVEYVELTQSVGTGSVTCEYDPSTTVNFNVTGLNADYMQAESIELLYGLPIQEGDVNDERHIVIVADRFVTDALNVAPANAIGQSFTTSLNGHVVTLYIAGVYKYDEDSNYNSYWGGDDEVITDMYIPITYAQTLMNADHGYQSLTIKPAVGVDATAFLTTAGDFFASYYVRNDSWTVEASSMQEMLESMTSMLNTVALAISAIAAIALLVGGIGVMNIMTVSVTERTREIGTRKALGAPGSAIRSQFVIEAAVICAIGGLIGVALGIGIGAVASQAMGYSAQASISTIILAVGFSMAIGIFFGYYPASKAAKMDPIEALRYE